MLRLAIANSVHMQILRIKSKYRMRFHEVISKTEKDACPILSPDKAYCARCDVINLWRSNHLVPC